MSMTHKLTELQIENFVLERYEQGYDIPIISRLLLVNTGHKRNVKNIEKILLNYKKMQGGYTTGRIGKGKTFSDRIATRDRYNHTLEK